MHFLCINASKELHLLLFLLVNAWVMIPATYIPQVIAIHVESCDRYTGNVMCKDSVDIAPFDGNLIPS